MESVRRSVEVEPVLHPEAGDEWFQKLSPEQQSRLHSTYQQSAGHDMEMVASVRRRLTITCIQCAALLGIFDALCPSASIWTVLVGAVSGASLGALLYWVAAARILSSTLAMLVFLLLEIGTRGGLSPLHFFWCVAVGAIAGLLSLRREFGD